MHPHAMKATPHNSDQCRTQLFDEVTTDYSRKIYGLCRQFFPHDCALCDDLYYDILGHIWHGLRDYRDEGHLATWVYRAALNTARSHLRERARRPLTVALPAADIDSPDAPPDPSPDVYMLELLYSLINRLPERDRQIIRLYLDDFSHVDIAAQTGLSVTNIATRINRIKNKLIKMYNETK